MLTSSGELAGRWAAVFEEAGVRPRVMELASQFPEDRSLEVPFSAIETADTALADEILVRPGERIAVDGTVIDSYTIASDSNFPVIQAPAAVSLNQNGTFTFSGASAISAS